MTTANEAPIILNIGWIVPAIVKEHAIQGITPGRPIKVSYSKFLAYCPQSTINAANRIGHPDFIAITACLELAEEHKLIIVERSNGRRSAYRLPPSHPLVKKATRVTSTGNLIGLV